MNDPEIRHLSTAELRAIETKAHELRAAAIGDTINFSAIWVKSALRQVRFYLSSHAHV